MTSHIFSLLHVLVGCQTIVNKIGAHQMAAPHLLPALCPSSVPNNSQQDWSTPNACFTSFLQASCSLENLLSFSSSSLRIVFTLWYKDCCWPHRWPFVHFLMQVKRIPEILEARWYHCESLPCRGRSAKFRDLVKETASNMIVHPSRWPLYSLATQVHISSIPSACNRCLEAYQEILLTHCLTIAR
jgi:hypothetical protein